MLILPQDTIQCANGWLPALLLHNVIVVLLRELQNGLHVKAGGRRSQGQLTVACMVRCPADLKAAAGHRDVSQTKLSGSEDLPNWSTNPLYRLYIYIRRPRPIAKA